MCSCRKLSAVFLHIFGVLTRPSVIDSYYTPLLSKHVVSQREGRRFSGRRRRFSSSRQLMVFPSYVEPQPTIVHSDEKMPLLLQTSSGQITPHPYSPTIIQSITSQILTQYHHAPSTQRRESIFPSVRTWNNNHGSSNDEVEPRYITLDVDKTFERLLSQEDVNLDKQITTDDGGPRLFSFTDLRGRKIQLQGEYELSNLLAELALLKERPQNQAQVNGKLFGTIDLESIKADPVTRIHSTIRDRLWDGLTRRIDREGLQQILVDEKGSKEGGFEQEELVLYVPEKDTVAREYFERTAAELAEGTGGGGYRRLAVRPAPAPPLGPAALRSLAARPGLLALGLRADGQGNLQGVPFAVPGGRFNEMYGWDSYFESLGLIADGKVALAKDMVDNFIYEIKYYGKILNANRSYYLGRSQPPFLPAMARAVWAAQPPGARDPAWLAAALEAALAEHAAVWGAAPRAVPGGLDRYYGSEGLGVPPEVERGHFDHVLGPAAVRAQMDPAEFLAGYQAGELKSPQLDAFFLHDQAVRESGHDTSARLNGKAAELLTVDLNSLLYKYEMDIAAIIDGEFGGEFFDVSSGITHTSKQWKDKASARARKVDALLWDEERGTYFDYDLGSSSGATVEGGGSDDSDNGDPAQGRPAGRTGFESATMVYPLWAGMASPEQAARVADYLARRLEEPGGLVSTSEASRGPVTPQRPQRQWDYPFGWAPHQMMAWQALADYGYEEQAQRLAYRWLLMLTQNYSDYNGVIPEKYDVVRRTHDVFDVEYGNVGTDFEYITKEGFGWMNASYQVGLSFLTPDQLFSLSKLKPTENVFRCEQSATVVPASGEMQQGIMKTVLGKSESTVTDNNKEEEDSKRIIMDTADDSAPSSFVAAGSSFSGEVLQPKKKKKEEQEHGGGFISSAFVPTTSCILF